MANIYDQIKGHKKEILEGTMLAIDPSSASSRSDPAWALFHKGKLISSGIIPVDKKQLIYEKLREQFDWIYGMFGEGLDVIAVEKIRKGHAYLRWSSCIAFLACRAPLVLELSPITWHNWVGDSYDKTDIHDAETIGLCIVNLAKKLKEE
jgi:hypothetical protein